MSPVLYRGAEGGRYHGACRTFSTALQEGSLSQSIIVEVGAVLSNRSFLFVEEPLLWHRDFIMVGRQLLKG